jgi:hypothetical protein
LRKCYLILFLCGLFVSYASAQTVDEDALLLELVAQQSRELHRDSIMLGDSVLVVCDTIWKSYPHPLCVPLMYVPAPMRSLRDTTPEDRYSIAAIRANARRYITTHCADLYTSVSDPDRLKEVALGTTKIRRATVKKLERDKLEASRALHKNSSPWRTEANLSLQLTQNYATENWHQGAANAFSMLWAAKAFANYKKNNISWENNAEWRMGVSTVSEDTLRKMNTTDDIFLIYSKLGYQVHAQWYVALFTEFRTNFFPNFKKNSTQMNATFLTPIRYTVGIGVDYKPLNGLSINLSPATYKLVYANISDATRVDVTEYGIEPGKNILNEIGSSVRVEWKWKPLREIELETKFYFFTNYKQIETELEIDVDFIINRYLSAKLILHPRYDGTIEDVTNQKSKLQFKELISVGFAHTFR